MPPLLVLLLLLVAFSGVRVADAVLQPRQAATDVEQIHLALGSAPGDRVVTFLTLTNAPGPVPTVSYGISGSDNNTWTYVPATGQKYRWSDWTGVIYRAQLTGLLPGIYDYQCSSDNSSFSAVHTFRVQDWVMTSGGSWTFGFTADMGWSANAKLVAASMGAVKGVDVWLLGGDLSYSSGWSTDPGVQARNDYFWRLAEQYGASAPVMTAPGNHESYDHHYAPYLARSGSLMPVGSADQLYYSFDYRNVHFVALSTDSLSRSEGPGDPEQMAWLVSDLQSANTRRAAGEINWIVLFFHYALYDSVRVPSGHGSDELLRVDLEAAIRPYAVDLILTGHDHLYERTYPVYEGVPYYRSGAVYTKGMAPVCVVSGTGGANFYAPFVQPQPAWSAFRSLFLGYTLATVYENGSLGFVAYNISGAVMDAFWLSPPTSPSPTTPIPTTTAPTTRPTQNPTTDPPTTTQTPSPSTSATPSPTEPPSSLPSPPPSPTQTSTEEPVPAPSASVYPTSTAAPTPSASLTPPRTTIEAPNLVLTTTAIRISPTAKWTLLIGGALFVFAVAVFLPGIICLRLFLAKRRLGTAREQEVPMVEHTILTNEEEDL